MVKKRPTVALFGGSFDPPHRGHQYIAQTVAARDGIDKVIVMPAFLNPFKKTTLASPKKRLDWCRQVCRGKKVIVSDFEISHDRPVYTIETLEMLQMHYLVKYLVIGADNLAEIERWEAFDKINESIIWLVFTRGTEIPDCHPLRHCEIIAMDIPVSATAIREGNDFDAVDQSILDEVKQLIHNKGNDDHQRES